MIIVRKVGGNVLIYIFSQIAKTCFSFREITQKKTGDEQEDCKKKNYLYAAFWSFSDLKTDSIIVGAALIEKLTDVAIAQLYVTKCLTISLYLSKLYVSVRVFAWLVEISDTVPEVYQLTLSSDRQDIIGTITQGFIIWPLRYNHTHYTITHQRRKKFLIGLRTF